MGLVCIIYCTAQSGITLGHPFKYWLPFFLPNHSWPTEAWTSLDPCRCDVWRFSSRIVVPRACLLAIVPTGAMYFPGRHTRGHPYDETKAWFIRPGHLLLLLRGPVLKLRWPLTWLVWIHAEPRAMMCAYSVTFLSERTFTSLAIWATVYQLHHWTFAASAALNAFIIPQYSITRQHAAVLEMLRPMVLPLQVSSTHSNTYTCPFFIILTNKP